MAQRYKYQCKQCQVTILVETTQAGQQVTCNSCESPQKLGTLREIRALPSEHAAQPVAEKKARPEWNPLRRGLLAAGLACVVLGGISGGYSWWKYSGLDTSPPDVERR